MKSECQWCLVSHDSHITGCAGFHKLYKNNLNWLIISKIQRIVFKVNTFKYKKRQFCKRPIQKVQAIHGALVTSEQEWNANPRGTLCYAQNAHFVSGLLFGWPQSNKIKIAQTQYLWKQTYVECTLENLNLSQLLTVVFFATYHLQ